MSECFHNNVGSHARVNFGGAGLLDTNQFISLHGGILIDTHWGEELIEFHPWDPIVILPDPGAGCAPPPVPEFQSLPACNPPRLSSNYRPTDSDWMGIWGDTGVDTDRDRIVVRVSAGTSPARFSVTARERVTVRGVPREGTAGSGNPGTPYAFRRCWGQFAPLRMRYPVFDGCEHMAYKNTIAVIFEFDDTLIPEAFSGSRLKSVCCGRK